MWNTGNKIPATALTFCQPWQLPVNFFGGIGDFESLSKYKSDKPTRHIALYTLNVLTPGYKDLFIELDIFGGIQNVDPFVLSDTSIISYFKIRDAQDAVEYINTKYTSTFKAVYAKSCLQKERLDDRFFISLTLQANNRYNYMEHLSSIDSVYSVSETFVSSSLRFVMIEYNDIRASKILYERLDNVTIDGIKYQILKCEDDHSICNYHSSSPTVTSNIIQRPYPKPTQKHCATPLDKTFSYFSFDPFSSGTDSSSSSAPMIPEFTVSPPNDKFVAINKKSPNTGNNLDYKKADDRLYDEKKLQEQSPKVQSSNNKSSKDRLSKERAFNGRQSRDRPPKDRLANNKSSKNKTSKNRQSNDKQSKDNSSKDRSSKDKLSKDRSSKDRPSKYGQLKNKASKAKSAGQQQSCELDLKKIASGENKKTTFMIRNIPNKYTQKMLIESLDKTHANTYDFIYLRMDFKNKCNVGYAFINFIDAKSVISFAEQRDGKRWELFKSNKKCSLSYATIQGKEALVRKFKSSPVMDEEEAFQPKLFYSSGPNMGKEQPFLKNSSPHARSRNNKCYRKH